jgi:hypothetical protein
MLLTAPGPEQPELPPGLADSAPGRGAGASLVDHRRRYPVEYQLGPAEEPCRVGVVDGNPVQVNEAAAWRPLSVRTFDVRGGAARFRTTAEAALDSPGRGRRVCRAQAEQLVALAAPLNSAARPQDRRPSTCQAKSAVMEVDT